MKKLVFLALSIILISCNKDQGKEAELLKEKITELENRLKITDSIKTKLHDRVHFLEYNFANIHDTDIESWLDIEPKIELEDSLSFLYNKEIFQYAFDMLNPKEYNIQRGFSNTTLFSSEFIDHIEEEGFTPGLSWGKRPVQQLEYYINLLIYNFSRSADILEDFFKAENKRDVYLLFGNNTLYRDTGIQAMVIAMVEAHQELEDKESLLSDFYRNADNAGFDYFNNIASNKVKELLSDENYSNYDNSWSDLDRRVFYVYSFWARRNHEENSEIVYKLLKELHENLYQKRDIDKKQEHGNIEKEQEAETF